MAVYKDKNGTWYVSARYTNWKGEADRKVKRGFQTKREAAEWEKNFFLENAGNLDMTFEAFYQLYKQNTKDRIKLNTWKMKESVIEGKILPYFRSKRMNEIKPRDVVNWQNTMMKMTDDNGKVIEQIELTKLHPFPDHPFGVRDDDSMQQTVESIREYGVLVPAIARPREDGGYELIAGHRRKHACELAGLKTMPVIVRDLDRNAAIIIMVDSNLQRESILPSEKAKAYKMKLEAIKRQGKRHDLTSTQPVSKLRSNEELGQSVNASRETIRRYIRLNELEPELMQMVDEGKIGMTPAVEISYLKPDEQKLLIETIDSEQATPSFSQAQRMKRLSQEGKLSDDAMLGIMMEQKKPENWDLKLPMDRIRKYFPRSYTPQRMEETIIKLLENWMKKRQRDQQR